MREFIFTFGFGQTNPDTGRSRASRFARIQAEEAIDARLLMIEQYGRAWAFQYDTEAEAGVAEFGLIELARVPCPTCDGTGTDSSRANDAVPDFLTGEPVQRGPEQCGSCGGGGVIEVELEATTQSKRD